MVSLRDHQISGHCTDLRFRHARFAGLQFALGTFVDPPVGPGVAHVAIPEDERGVGLDHLEGVFAFAWLGHCVVLRLSCGQCWSEQILVEVRRTTHDLMLVREGVKVNTAPMTNYADMLPLLARSDL
jgi:hypothetical protein